MPILLNLWNGITQFNSKTKSKSIPGKFAGNPGMVHFAEISQASPPYSMYWSQNLCEVLTLLNGKGPGT